MLQCISIAELMLADDWKQPTHMATIALKSLKRLRQLEILGELTTYSLANEINHHSHQHGYCKGYKTQQLTKINITNRLLSCKNTQMAPKQLYKPTTMQYLIKLPKCQFLSHSTQNKLSKLIVIIYINTDNSNNNLIKISGILRPAQQQRSSLISSMHSASPPLMVP